VITTDELHRIAALAKLSFDDQHIEQFRAEFERIVEYVSTLNRISALDQCEPLDSVVTHTNAFAEDMPHRSLTTEEALSNAPRHNESFFKVPKVIASASPWVDETAADSSAE
jgi:aspartyl-tRNA(Asn)/glutamyl-tRNA(Gln) amidotransferase subunit C